MKRSCANLAGAIVCALNALMFVQPARAGEAALVWSQRAGNGPAPRAEFGLSYDCNRGVTVLFGGANDLTFTSVFPDTWEWDGRGWQLRSNSGPTPRCDHAQAYDCARGVTVIFGGFNGGFLGDTWEWSGISGQWTFRTNIGPSPRADSFMVYDNARQRMVLFGGLLATGAIAGDTWEYDGAANQWTQRAFTGPEPRWIQRMAYDASRAVTVMFGGADSGGQPLATTGEWNGAPQPGVWAQRPEAGPSTRFGNAMAYDSHRAVSVLFGGGTSFVGGGDDTWEWNGALPAGGWTQRRIAGPSPSPRTFVKIAYDSARRRMVLFGGVGGIGGQFLNDTWELDSSVPGDVTGDGAVNVDDLIAVILSWGPCPAPPAECPADLDDSGSVDVDDLIIVILNWG